MHRWYKVSKQERKEIRTSYFISILLVKENDNLLHTGKSGKYIGYEELKLKNKWRDCKISPSYSKWIQFSGPRWICSKVLRQLAAESLATSVIIKEIVEINKCYSGFQKFHKVLSTNHRCVIFFLLFFYFSNLLCYNRIKAKF